MADLDVPDPRRSSYRRDYSLHRDIEEFGAKVPIGGSRSAGSTSRTILEAPDSETVARISVVLEAPQKLEAGGYELIPAAKLLDSLSG